MGLDAWITAGVVLVMVVALVREMARPDVILLGSLGVLLLAGVLTPEEAFKGFASSAVLTIAALYVVAAGVQRTDGLAVLDRLLFSRRQSGLSVTLLRLMPPVALLSAFVNNTPLVAMLLPRLQGWAERTGVPASKVMIPLSYAAVLGGMVTLIGTSTNLVVSGMMLEMTGQGFGMFDLTWVGLPAATVAILYFSLVGHRMLPGRRANETGLGEAAEAYQFELRVGERSPVAGRSVEEAELRALGDAFLTHVRRGSHVVGPVGPQEVLQEGDVLAFTGSPLVIDRLLERSGLERAVRGLHTNGHSRLPLFEAVVSGSSTLQGKTLREADFRNRYQGVVLAIQRRNEQLTEALGNIPIQSGDLLLIEAQAGFDERWNSERETFYLVAPRSPARPGPLRHKAPVALLIGGAMVFSAAAGLVPLVTAAFVAALGMIATGCLPGRESRQAVDFAVLLMIAAAFGIGEAIEGSGLATMAAQAVVRSTEAYGPLTVLIAIYITTNVVTELLTNAAAAALVVPVALATAVDLGLSPTPFALAVAVAASAGFATPFGYQTNLMVMSAGGYRFSDYVKAGLPLNFIVMAVAVTMIWLVWL